MCAKNLHWSCCQRQGYGAGAAAPVCPMAICNLCAHWPLPELLNSNAFGKLPPQKTGFFGDFFPNIGPPTLLETPPSPKKTGDLFLKKESFLDDFREF